jgi:hypothetical protein
MPEAQKGVPGMVFATEVDAGEVENLEREVERRGLTNVRVLSGNQNRTGLPAHCCAGILVREA